MDSSERSLAARLARAAPRTVSELGAARTAAVDDALRPSLAGVWIDLEATDG